MALRQGQTAQMASSCYSLWMAKLNVCKHMCMYCKSFQLPGLGTHSTLELFGLFMPHCLLNTCTCSAANPNTTDSPAAHLGPHFVPAAASCLSCLTWPVCPVPVARPLYQFAGQSSLVLPSLVWLHLDLQKLTPCFAGTTDSPALVTCGLTPCLGGAHGHQAVAQERVAKGDWQSSRIGTA